MKTPLCTLINNSCSFFYSVYLEHCKIHMFSDDEHMAITTQFLGVHYDTKAIYIANCSNLLELKAAVKQSIHTLGQICPNSNTRIYVHWPEFQQLNQILCNIASEILHETIFVKCMQPKMINVASRCLDARTVTPLMLSAMFNCYHLKHLEE